MKVTVDGVIYEGTEDEIRRIVEDLPCRPSAQTPNRPNTDRLQPRDLFGAWVLPDPDSVPFTLCEGIE